MDKPPRRRGSHAGEADATLTPLYCDDPSEHSATRSLGGPKPAPIRGRGTQRLVSYLVRSTPSGNVRVSTRFRFTQLSRAVKNGVPPPTRTGWVTIRYSSISPARMAAAARVAP